MKGYELHKTGARVKELLERQFVVPTLDNAPTQDTLSWQDGKYVVEFRIGELCRVREGEEWKFFRLNDINDGVAEWQEDNAQGESEGVVILSQEDYDALVANDTISASTIYFVTTNGDPTTLYIGKILIAQREEGSKGFAYNFPIIF